MKKYMLIMILPVFFFIGCEHQSPTSASEPQLATLQASFISSCDTTYTPLMHPGLETISASVSENSITINHAYYDGECTHLGFITYIEQNDNIINIFEIQHQETDADGNLLSSRCRCYYHIETLLTFVKADDYTINIYKGDQSASYLYETLNVTVN
ncbi:MAG: hypothetical protein JXR81_10480 [Candidatus Goldbacteria bacterium]|nr:hypothetical protein [Candidatus Goldiibacteriota bacterium]